MDKNNFHKFFRSEREELPEHLSWENVADGIFAEMDSIEKSNPPSGGRYLPYVIIGGLLLVSIIIISITFKNSTDKEVSSRVKVKQETKITSSNKDKQNTVNSKTPFETNTYSTATSTESTSTKSLIDNTPKTKNTTAIKKEQKQINIQHLDQNTRKDVNHQQNDQQELLTTKNQNTTAAREHHELTIYLHENEITTETKEPNYEQSLPNEIKVPASDPSYIKAIDYLDYTINPLDLPLRRLPAKEGDLTKLNPKASKWTLGLYATLNYWSPMYKGDLLAEQKADTEKSILGYGIETRLQYDINAKWQISSGIEFMQRESRLNYEGNRDTTVVKNVVTHVQVNSLTGERIAEYRSDVDLNGIIKHRVIHYNKYQQWSVPILISRQWKIKKRFTINTGVGTKYTLKSITRGKTLDWRDTEQSSILPRYIQAEDYKQKNIFSLLTDIGIQYKLTKHWNIGVATQFSKTITDLDTEVTTSSRPIIISTRAGILYRF